MKLKEKCIYYNSSKGSCYLVLSGSDMIYGRYGEMENPNYLDSYMNQDGTGLKFKIDDIIIHMESYRNYYLNDKELAEFEFVRELTDEEFYPMELLIHSHYKYPEIIVDVHKHTDNISNLVHTIKYKKSEMEKLEKDICKLEKELFVAMQ